MRRDVRIAAIQMDASPAQAEERLERAERLVVEAAGAGAQLIVLPELFNTGYDYAESNYCRAELPDGPTVVWLRATASRLAGGQGVGFGSPECCVQHRRPQPLPAAAVIEAWNHADA